MTELSAGALQAPWLLSLLGRFLWNEAGGERRHHAINMHHTAQSKPIKKSEDSSKTECGTVWERLLAVQIILTCAAVDSLFPAAEIENNIPEWSARAQSTFLYPEKISEP